MTQVLLSGCDLVWSLSTARMNVWPTSRRKGDVKGRRKGATCAARGIRGRSERRRISIPCWHDCGGACALKALVEDGKIVRVKTDDTHPDSWEHPQNGACAMGRAMRQKVYGPGRLKHPMKRKHWSPEEPNGHLRGTDEWEQISWDEAFDYIADALKSAKESYGNESILYQRSEGYLEPVLSAFGGYVDALGNTSYGTFAFGGPTVGFIPSAGNDRFDLKNSDYLVLYGYNLAWCGLAGAGFNLKRALEDGAKVVFVGPEYSATAGMANAEWIPVRRSTDIHVIISDQNNVLNNQPGLNKGIEAHRKMDFVAALGYTMKADAMYADVVLPITTRIERQQAMFYAFFREKESAVAFEKAVEPMYECKDDREIAEAIAVRLGLDYAEINPKADAQLWFEQMDGTMVLYDTGKMEIYSLKKAVAHNFINGGFGGEGAPSYVKVSALPKYLRAPNDYQSSFEDWDAKKPGAYPVQLTSLHYPRRIHSEFDDLPWLREAFANPVFVNKRDAAERGIGQGDVVRVFNEYGQILRPAAVVRTVMPGVILIPHGARPRIDAETGIDLGGNMNTLTGSGVATTPFVQPWNTGLCQFEKYEGPLELPPDCEVVLSGPLGN